FEVTLDTLAFGYILPTTGQIRDFNPLETCAARRTSKGRWLFSTICLFLFTKLSSKPCRFINPTKKL
ncbi:hypothetical protein, partial [Oribacterium sinus]|uniref:hypothetical protein n=1 Tax=Oribacterium sinus TaxID=237576 RepID=UPI0028E3B731